MKTKPRAKTTTAGYQPGHDFSLSGRIILFITGQAKKSAVFFLYCALLAALCTSVVAQSGSGNTFPLMLYAASLTLGYMLLYRLFCRQGKAQAPAEAQQGAGLTLRLDQLADGLLIACAGFIVLHFAYLGQVPLVAGILSNDYFDIMRIRQSVFFEAPVLFRYLPNILLKSVLPFLMLYYCAAGRKKNFWITAGLATCYGLALLNKMFVVILYAPLVLYLLFNRRFLASGAIALIPVAALALLVFVQNPHIRPEFWTPRNLATASGKPLVVEAPTVLAVLAAKKRTESTSYPALKFVETIYLRIFVVPGQVVSVWFSNIPERLPFANGCGYRLVAALRGCEFQFYPALVHDIENPALVAEGIRGTMTAASFMEDYANFGTRGLVLGGALLALVLALITRMFAGDWRWALILNLIPIAMMMELPLSTVLLTGGWASTLLLYRLFRTGLPGRWGLDLARLQAGQPAVKANPAWAGGWAAGGHGAGLP
jgi:hypothetical protein